MPKRRRKAQIRGLGGRPEAIVDDIIEGAVDSLFSRVGQAWESFRERSHESLPADYRARTFTCGWCRGTGPIEAMELVHPSNGVGLCEECLGFLVQTGEQKLKVLKARAEEQMKFARPAEAPRPKSAPVAPKPIDDPPWKILGVEPDANIAEIKKAYHRLAMQWHPDRLDANATLEQRQRSRMQFERVTRAYTVMRKVREAPEA